MINKNAPLELYNPRTGDTWDVTCTYSYEKVINISRDYRGLVQYHLDTGVSVVPSENPCILRNKKVDVNLVDQINNAGWVIARLGQDDNQLWHYEIREGYATSYNMVSVGDGFAFIDEALEDAFKKIANVNKLKALAKDLGITGKVNF